VANRKISQLTALTTPAAGDYLPIVDISEAADADKNKRITIEELLRGAPDGTAAAPSIAFESDPDSGLYSTGANGLALATGGTGRLFIDSSGRVGVGASPGVFFDIDDPGTGLRFKNAGSGNFNIGLLGGISSSNSYIFNRANSPLILGTNNIERLHITSSGQLSHIGGGSVGSPAVAFNGSAPSNSLVIDSTGKVGVGTSSPESLLHLQGSSPVLTIKDSDTAGENLTGYVLIEDSAGTNKAYIGRAGSSDLRIFGTGDTVFATGGLATTNERARIASDGKLGVGTSSPQDIQHLYNSSGDAVLRLQSDGTNGNKTGIRFQNSLDNSNHAGGIYCVRNSGTDHDLFFQTYGAGGVGSDRMVIKNNGRVGIGTTSPGERLHVSGGNQNIRLSGSYAASQSNKIEINNGQTGASRYAVGLELSSSGTGGYTSAVYTSAGSDTRYAFIAGAPTTTRFLTSNIERARIDSSGTFRVKGAGTAGTTDAVQLNGSAPANSLLLDASGRLGVGTSSPAQLLHLKSGGDTKLLLNSTNNASDRGIYFATSTDSEVLGYIKQEYSTGKFEISSGSGSYASSISFRTGGIADRVVIDSSGRVGIGTTNPGYNLQVAGANSTVAINATNASLSSVGTLLYRNTDGNGQPREVASIEGETAGNGGYGALAFQTAFNNSLFERARIDRNGRFLVGTVSSSANTRVIIAGNSGTPTAAADLRLQRGSANPASGVGLGALYFTDSNEVIGAGVSAVADGAWASNDYPTRLVFSTTADGSSSPTERMRITSGGFLCATESGSLKSTSLHNIKATSAQTTFAFYNTNASSPAGVLINFDSASPNATGNHFLYCSDLTAQRASIRSNGGLANYQSNNVDLSDERSKRNIAPASSTWNYVQAWEVVNYNYLEDAVEDAPRVGVIAQQVQQHCPDVVIPFQEAENAILDDDGNVVTPAKEERLGVREQQMMWMAIKALQEAQLRIEALEAKVAALEAQ